MAAAFKTDFIAVSSGQLFLMTACRELAKCSCSGCQCTISLTVEDNQLVHICNCTSAKDMWKQLQKVHERSNLSSKMYLRKKLYNMRLQDEQNMQEYISAVLRLVELIG